MTTMFSLGLNVFLILLVSGLLYQLFTKNKQQKSKQSHQESQNDLLWKSILRLTSSDALHANWHVSFHQIQSDLRFVLEANEIFLLDNSPALGSPPLQTTETEKNSYLHNWILSVPHWMDSLEKGEIIHSFSADLDFEEQAIVEQEGIRVILLLPLLVEGKLETIIGACRQSDTQLFSQQQINSLQFITNILAMAISNQYDRTERDRLVTVVEQSVDCIIVVSISGAVLYANKACEEVTGFSPDEIIGKSIKIIFPHHIRKILWQRLKNNLKQGKDWSGQFSTNRKDGTLYEEEMLISPVLSQDKQVTNLVLVKRDITEEKRLESIAEAANLMDNIGFIFSSIRHELGNPLNSLKVSLSVLESNLDTYDSSDIKRFISRGLFDIGRIEYLLKSLKNFSVFEQPNIQVTDMQALLQKLTQLTEKDLARQYVMLAIIPPTEPLKGLIDPRAFLQVLLNLITNAVAAMEETENKMITITLCQKQEKQITFTIEDNGCGMDETVAKNLFRPFFTTKTEGTGLGLVIVKKMLSKMNCSISAHSEKGKGTSMEIIIPSLE